MTIFAVLMPAPQPALAQKIRDAFPEDSMEINETQWLVSFIGTAMEVTARIGIANPNNPHAPSAGSAIVFATSSYYGRAPTPVWDWIKSKLEKVTSGG